MPPVHGPGEQQPGAIGPTLLHLPTSPTLLCAGDSDMTRKG